MNSILVTRVLHSFADTALAESRILVTNGQTISYTVRKWLSGEAGIRTLGPPQADNGFRDRRFRPLSHLSGHSAPSNM